MRFVTIQIPVCEFDENAHHRLIHCETRFMGNEGRAARNVFAGCEEVNAILLGIDGATRRVKSHADMIRYLMQEVWLAQTQPDQSDQSE